RRRPGPAGVHSHRSRPEPARRPERGRGRGARTRPAGGAGAAPGVGACALRAHRAQPAARTGRRPPGQRCGLRWPGRAGAAMTRRGPVVVVGDTLLDRDVDGVVERLCPDAPVPVLDEQADTERPGGAGLAALLAAGQGREVVLVTALAGDAGGARLSRLLAGVEVHALALTGPTPEKIRLRAGGRTLLRLDRGGAGGRCGEPAGPALAALGDAAVILVSDYGRGVARQPALRAALAATAAPVVWDPHPRGPVPIRNTRLATPNEAEVRHLAGYDGRDPLATAHRGGEVLRQRWRAAAVAVTMGERGALLCHAGPTPLVAPAPRRADGDTCGAGDAFA